MPGTTNAMSNSNHLQTIFEEGSLSAQENFTKVITVKKEEVDLSMIDNDCEKEKQERKRKELFSFRQESKLSDLKTDIAKSFFFL